MEFPFNPFPCNFVCVFCTLIVIAAIDMCLTCAIVFCFIFSLKPNFCMSVRKKNTSNFLILEYNLN